MRPYNHCLPDAGILAGAFVEDTERTLAAGFGIDDRHASLLEIENIARHWAMKDGRPRLQATIEAVAEVGNPTVIATLTVVAALLPMLFVSGLMGPYMAPIPANASAAMLFSFFVAMVVAPWLHGFQLASQWS